jgi:ABC-2 type transport system ATP-binding protein
MSAIRIEGLRKTYGAVTALDGLDLAVEPGSVFGFLGPNGAGKTTTLRLLTGLAAPTAGRACVDGVPVAGAEAKVGAGAAAGHFGFLPEEPAFYNWMTAREFLDHVGRVFGLNAAARAARLRELLDLAGLSEAANRHIGGFSRGMRQRLGLAQALVSRPAVLFLDEPTSALDPAGRKEVLELIQQLRGQTTVFMSTHILADVERVCDTVGILARGRLVAHAPRETLLAQYALPIFEVEVELDAEAALAAWAEAQRTRPFVESVTLLGATARIMVSDVAAARAGLLPSVMQAGLVLTRYELMRPSLEDVFLRLVNTGEKWQPDASRSPADRPDELGVGA